MWYSILGIDINKIGTIKAREPKETVEVVAPVELGHLSKVNTDMNTKLKWLFLWPVALLALTTSLTVIATSAEIDSNKSVTTPALSITPRLCISTPEDPSCNITLTLQWPTLNAPVCIRSTAIESNKWCTGSAEVKSLAVKVRTQEDIEFLLVNENTNQQIDDVTFKVTPVTEPQVRRRYRNPWSLFK